MQHRNATKAVGMQHSLTNKVWQPFMNLITLFPFFSLAASLHTSFSYLAPTTRRYTFPIMFYEKEKKMHSFDRC